MATYKGQKKVNVSSYANFKKEILGNGYDVDNTYGCQCYDLASLFWLNTCNRWVKSATKDGGVKGGASGIWGARAENNKGNEFELITDVKKLKQGDIIITNNGKYGHVCFLDKDGYVLGQNQGGTSGKMPGAKCCVIKWNYKKYFLGAFRYKKWNPAKSYKKVSATAGLWLRDKKGTSSKKIKLLVYGTKVEVLETNAGTANGYTWSKIKVGDKTGYVALKYLK